MDDPAAAVLLAKPERIDGFDDELVQRLSSRLSGRSAALVEIAGRDSLAAAAVFSRSGSCRVLVPTITYTGTEYGNWGTLLANARAVTDDPGINNGLEVTETVILGSPGWWHAGAGRLAGEFNREYRFMPVCVACHMYLHASRVPLARAIGARTIVAGERLRHDNRFKLNQIAPAVEAYRRVLAAAGVDLELPLLEAESASYIEGLVGPEHADPHRQMKCTFEGNYRDARGGFSPSVPGLEPFLDRFLEPFTRAVLQSFAAGEKVPRYLELALAAFSDQPARPRKGTADTGAMN